MFQMETMKASLTTNVGNLHHDLEIFAGSWKEFASKQAFGNDLRSLLSAIKEKRKECTELLARKESLLSNCARLNMVLPELSSLKSTAEDLIEQEAMWKLFEEFYSGNCFNFCILELPTQTREQVRAFYLSQKSIPKLCSNFHQCNV